LPAAAAIGREVLALQPKLAEALHLMGAIALQRERFDEAVGLIEQAIALDGKAASFHNSLGQAQRGRGATNLALASYERALALNPRFGPAHANIAQLFLAGPPAAAVAYHRQLAAALPRNAIARANLAYMIERTGDLAGAETVYREALALEPNQVVAHVNLGIVLADLGRIDEAMAHYRTALALDPGNADAHNALGLALLLRGDYGQAWPHHESRPRDWVGEFRVPRWQGEPLDGQRILLHAEQGMGDTLQFIRYVPMVAMRGGRIVLAVSPALARLVEGMAGVEQVVIGSTPPGGLDWHCPLMSLPLAFGTTIETIPAEMPYLHAGATEVAAWREVVAAIPGLRIGLVWGGSSRIGQPHAVAIDRRRSLPLAALAPLADVRGCSFVSLQLGPPACQAPPPGLVLHDFTHRFGDFASTAALVAVLDLVITVDTAVAHLAGALGKPVWLLNRFDTCWRWLLDRDDSPWYPTLRQFRQPAPGDWRTPVARIAAALSQQSGGEALQF
jgi:Flp pilus assembly protein TadD